MALTNIIRGAVKAARTVGQHPITKQVGSWVKEHQSVTDEFLTLSKDQDLTDKLLPSTYRGVHDSATAYQTNARLAGELELDGVHRVLDQESGMTGMQRITNMRQGTALRNSLQEQAMSHLYDAHRAELDGMPMPAVPSDPRVAKIVQAYHSSGYAEAALKRMQDSGMESAQGVKSSPNYIPIQHDAHKVFRAINGNEKNFKVVAGAYGEQLLEQYPGLLKVVGRVGEDVAKVQERIGSQFLNNMKRRMQDSSAVIEGTTKEQLEDVLRASGADDVTVESVLRNLTPNLEAAGETKHLRARVGWDMNRMYTLADGSTFKILNGVNTNMEQVLKTYNNTTSARVGLAQKGFANSKQISSAFNTILEQHVGDPAAYARAKDFLGNTKNMLLGKPVGEIESNWLQAGGVIGRALHLKNSGIYNIIDYANTVREFGLSTVMDHFKKGFDSVNPKDIDPATAQTVTDIIRNKLINEGKLRTVQSHLDSGYQTSEGAFMQGINLAGQSIKYLNASEFVRRQHIGIITGIQGSLLEELGTGGAKAAEYFKSVGMSDTRITELAAAIKEHGLYDSLWPRDLADEVGTRLLSSVDTMALQVRKGELPSLLAYNNVGRVLFPYFSFVAASHNKILRKEYQRTGATGVAMHMLTSAPLAYTAAVMANITSNKDPFENVNSKALGLLPTLGYGGALTNFGIRGEFGGTPVPFAMINAIPGLLSGAAKGDVNEMVKNSPLLAVALPVRTVISVLDND